MVVDSGQVYRIEDYRPSDYLIPRTRLTFRLDPDATQVVAEIDVERRHGAPLDAPLSLDGDGLELAGVTIDGRKPAASVLEASPDRLLLKRLPVKDAFTIRIETRLAPAANGALMGLYLSNGIYCTQCEAEGFRRITYFLDRPDVLSVYTVRVEAPQATAPILLSNGNRVESGPLDDGRHYAVWHDPHPKPSYLFALVAGDLGRLGDSFVTASGREVELAIYVEHGKEARAAYAMDALKRSMIWDEEVFGLEYDLEVFNIVAVPDFNMGAMENKGLNIFNDKYVLADEDTATDADYASIEAIVAHEYFHNWTGNRITCRDWFQLCLKEGLTVFRDREFSADQRSRPVERIGDVRALRAHQFPEDQGPLAHPVRPRRYREINNFYTATVYEKGAEVVRMIRTVVGDAAFRQGMRIYVERHDGQAVTIEDFVRAFEEASGRDLAQFALWYHQAGTPNIAISESYDAGAGTLTLDIEQTLPPTPSESRKRLMHIPLAFGLLDENGKALAYQGAEGAAVEDGVIHIRKRRHAVRLHGVEHRPVVSINRGFSSPVTIAHQRPPRDRLLLARRDDDLFGRWEALNTLVTEELSAAFRALLGGREPDFAPELVALAGEIAGDASLEPAYRALALTLPSETDVAREIGSQIDPDAVHAARNRFVTAIARTNADAFAAARESMRDGRRFSPDSESAGRRALANVLLDYLAAASDAPDEAASAYANATNMTDRFAALGILAHRFAERPESVDALADFERRYGGDPLVMDKWFLVQATVPGAGALDTVRRLTQHAAYSPRNPNRVRSLIGAFANGNQTGFHRRDGESYRFFADTVLTIDRINPQVAARLATALRSWRLLEPERQAAARSALVMLAEPQDISPDLRDIVDRTLA